MKTNGIDSKKSLLRIAQENKHQEIVQLPIQEGLTTTVAVDDAGGVVRAVPGGAAVAHRERRQCLVIHEMWENTPGLRPGSGKITRWPRYSVDALSQRRCVSRECFTALLETSVLFRTKLTVG